MEKVVTPQNENLLSSLGTLYLAGNFQCEEEE